MGSSSDTSHCQKVKAACESLGVPCELRVTSAHKQTEQTMRLLAEYEGTIEDAVLAAGIVPHATGLW